MRWANTLSVLMTPVLNTNQAMVIFTGLLQLTLSASLFCHFPLMIVIKTPSTVGGFRKAELLRLGTTPLERESKWPGWIWAIAFLTLILIIVALCLVKVNLIYLVINSAKNQEVILSRNSIIRFIPCSLVLQNGETASKQQEWLPIPLFCLMRFW